MANWPRVFAVLIDDIEPTIIIRSLRLADKILGGKLIIGSDFRVRVPAAYIHRVPLHLISHFEIEINKPEYPIPELRQVTITDISATRIRLTAKTFTGVKEAYYLILEANPTHPP